MRYYPIFLIACSASFASVVLGQSLAAGGDVSANTSVGNLNINYTTCPGYQSLNVTGLSIVPWPPVAGEDATVFVEGNLISPLVVG